MNRQNILFITGTDTDVGKTVASLLAMHALAGRDAVYLKPVQTGCVDPDVDSDPAFIHRHLPGGLPGGMTPADCIHTLRPRPKAPLFAGDPVDSEAVLDFIARHAARHEIVVVEGAGGILVPVTTDATMLDLALAVRACILVAGRAGLGTINHTLLTLQAIQTAGGNCLGAVLLDPTDATPEADRTENIQAIEHFSGLPVFGVIGRIADLAHPCPAAENILEKALYPFLARP
jgi:dethiobiotin synthetase